MAEGSTDSSETYKSKVYSAPAAHPCHIWTGRCRPLFGPMQHLPGSLTFGLHIRISTRRVSLKDTIWSAGPMHGVLRAFSHLSGPQQAHGIFTTFLPKRRTLCHSELISKVGSAAALYW